MIRFVTPGSPTSFVVTIRLEVNAPTHEQAMSIACRRLANEETTVAVLCVETSAEELFSVGGES